jgi:hypothetical protein
MNKIRDPQIQRPLVMVRTNSVKYAIDHVMGHRVHIYDLGLVLTRLECIDSTRCTVQGPCMDGHGHGGIIDNKAIPPYGPWWFQFHARPCNALLIASWDSWPAMGAGRAMSYS